VAIWSPAAMTGLRSGLKGDAWAACALWDRCSDQAEARAVCLGSRYTSRPSLRTRRQISRAANAISTMGASGIQKSSATPNDDDRLVIWSNGASPNKPYPYRDSADGVRSHLDVPIAELASLALPFVRLRMSDEEVIRRLADHFQLGRLREGARTRF
jgi:hypothetical protein